LPISEDVMSHPECVVVDTCASRLTIDGELVRRQWWGDSTGHIVVLSVGEVLAPKV
jgi:hypothetical protein